MAITAGRRLLEDGSFRLLEEGGIRLLEDFDLEGGVSIEMSLNMTTGATMDVGIAGVDEVDVNVRTAGTIGVKMGN
jgi:hypothetical protein